MFPLTGDSGTAQSPGIIFLTMQELFEKIQELQAEKATEVSLSYLEIYNETIRDLLDPLASRANLMLREDAHQAVSVPGLSSHRPQNVSPIHSPCFANADIETRSQRSWT